MQIQPQEETFRENSSEDSGNKLLRQFSTIKAPKSSKTRQIVKINKSIHICARRVEYKLKLEQKTSFPPDGLTIIQDALNQCEKSVNRYFSVIRRYNFINFLLAILSFILFILGFGLMKYKLILISFMCSSVVLLFFVLPLFYKKIFMRKYRKMALKIQTELSRVCNQFNQQNGLILKLEMMPGLAGKWIEFIAQETLSNKRFISEINIDEQELQLSKQNSNNQEKDIHIHSKSAKTKNELINTEIE